LSQEFQDEQANMWTDYNRCVNIYNSADYTFTGDYSNSRILIRNENGNEVIYKLGINENRLQNIKNNEQFSFTKKCFRTFGYQLSKIVIGKTYRFGRLGGRPDYEGALQYLWKDDNKNDLIRYKKEVPYEPIIQEVVVQKCPIKVKQNEIRKEPGLKRKYIDF